MKENYKLEATLQKLKEFKEDLSNHIFNGVVLSNIPNHYWETLGECINEIEEHLETGEETYEDLFISRFIFVNALHTIIPEGEGVFLVFENKEYDFKRVIVHNRNGVIGVLLAEERTDLKHGDWVKMINEDLIKN